MNTPYLRSWKEIADYLKTSVRTAQRYEKIGLPVHRLPGMNLGGVFAVRTELDAWLLHGGLMPLTVKPGRATTQAGKAA